ncbi:MAG: DUF4316 domain-containing protein [Ethanoligenens sp.]
MYDNLPEISYVRNLSDGQVVAIKRGESGYYPYSTEKTVEELNQTLGVTKAQAAAMQFGSMFGWDVPGANPAAYDTNGIPLAEDGRPENYLKNAELYTEQNYDCIDGLIDNVDTVQEEGSRTNQEKCRPSNESEKPDKSTKRHNKSRDIER